MGRHLDQAAQSVGLNMTQAVALRGLDEPVSQRHLSDQLGCDASYVTGIVDHLERLERGLSPDELQQLHDLLAKVVAAQP